MKKLFSSLIIVMMIALACVAVASAAEVYTPDADGLYNIEYAVTADDGTQFGMVVIEATGDEAFALDEATIRYIDQVGAADGAITFDAFAPMDLKNEGTYKVYIGGGDLTEATYIGTLGEAAATPEVTSVTLAPTAATVKVGETVTLTATVNDGLTPALTWESNDTTVATVENGVVTGVEAGTATITVTAAPGVTATATITVEAAAAPSDRLAGDAFKNGTVDGMDALWILRHVAGHTGLANWNAENADCFGNGNGVDGMDALWILRWVAGHNVTLQ